MFTIRISLIAFLFSGILGTQYLYDAKKIQTGKTVAFPLSADFLKSVDAGLHSMLASYFWLFGARGKLVGFILSGKEGAENRYQQFSRDFDLVNKLDPKYSTPYAYATIVLPASKYLNTIHDSIEIGVRGVREADPDWKIPFYLATTYHLELKDHLNAARYFDLASRRPGIPELVRRYAINYGIFPNNREKTKQLWITIGESASDEFTKERAAAYVRHFEIIDYLDSAVQTYKKKYRAYPSDVADLVAKNIIPEIPRDPFGFEFQMYPEGQVGIKPAR